MKVTINSLDTYLSICTYSMFTGENVIEMETDYQRDELGNENPDFEIDHKKVVQELAIESISYLENQLIGNDIIKGIKLKSTHSPKFYNYTTDSYDMEFDFNSKKLLKYLKNCNYLVGEVEELKDKYNFEKYEAELVVFIDNIIDIEAYNMWMFEAETEIYMDNLKCI